MAANVGQAANLTSEGVPVGCYRPSIYPSPFVLLLSHKVNTHLMFHGGERMKGWINLGAAVSVPKAVYCRPAVVFMKNTELICSAGSILGPLE